jgi:hypothetical protein
MNQHIVLKEATKESCIAAFSHKNYAHLFEKHKKSVLMKQHIPASLHLITVSTKDTKSYGLFGGLAAPKDGKAYLQPKRPYRINIQISLQKDPVWIAEFLDLEDSQHFINLLHEKSKTGVGKKTIVRLYFNGKLLSRVVLDSLHVDPPFAFQATTKSIVHKPSSTRLFATSISHSGGKQPEETEDQ